MVTFPRNKLKDLDNEEREIRKVLSHGDNINYFWCLSQKPKNLNIGDKVYFIWNSKMRGYHIVVGFGNDMKCTTTGIQYEGYCIILDTQFHELEEPVTMNGFRGFRYIK